MIIDVLHKHLKENAQKLLGSKGDIGCPAAYLNKAPAASANVLLPACDEWTMTCLHVCGTIFPRWKDITYFKESGVKLSLNDCPCNSPLILIADDEWPRVKDVFWAYVDKVLTTDKSNLPPGVF